MKIPSIPTRKDLACTLLIRIAGQHNTDDYKSMLSDFKALDRTAKNEFYNAHEDKLKSLGKVVDRAVGGGIAFGVGLGISAAGVGMMATGVGFIPGIAVTGVGLATALGGNIAAISAARDSVKMRGQEAREEGWSKDIHNTLTKCKNKMHGTEGPALSTPHPKSPVRAESREASRHTKKIAEEKQEKTKGRGR